MDYGFTRDGRVYTPNGTPGIAPAENANRNAAIEQAELANWHVAPMSAVGYFTFPAEAIKVSRQYRDTFHLDTRGATVTTWLGTPLGKIVSARCFRHNFGGRMVAMRVIGTNGATYAGRASYDHGQCVNLRKTRA